MARHCPRSMGRERSSPLCESASAGSAALGPPALCPLITRRAGTAVYTGTHAYLYASGGGNFYRFRVCFFSSVFPILSSSPNERRTYTRAHASYRRAQRPFRRSLSRFVYPRRPIYFLNRFGVSVRRSGALIVRSLSSDCFTGPGDWRNHRRLRFRVATVSTVSSGRRLRKLPRTKIGWLVATLTA